MNRQDCATIYVQNLYRNSTFFSSLWRMGLPRYPTGVLALDRPDCLIQPPLGNFCIHHYMDPTGGTAPCNSRLPQGPAY